ncbi:isochorismatase family protein [Halomonas sp. MCCC 1A17488]|uniref:isochorismatase family protein n=1 Tax=unclassified Halomonas TaxID=2609666 RepID=UPI0018D21E04|nr:MULTISPECIES: isochorismatase family protein [unclassified Halomonas]MCE8016242.1 isochorismatase family protein [Halomonas sp. MCCC 1A17488]MCG3239575.1 isochorismatase family protein [Halomonas sp. MCCC 1A17488]QPP50509.1 isochorismatase family protein [Halomonas sp. SS10-MC5]
MASEDLQNNYRNTFNDSTGFGKSTAVLAIVFMKAYTLPDSGLYAEGVVEAVKQAATVYDCARRCDVPVIHTRVVYSVDGADGGVFIEKLPVLRQMTESSIYSQFNDNVLPAEGESVIRKQYPSAFFSTPLVSMLVAKGVDTVVLTGCSTSGCVRASVVDAISYGFRVVVPRECVGDRHQNPHESNLFDIHTKYGDVISMSEVIKHFEVRKEHGS